MSIRATATRRAEEAEDHRRRMREASRQVSEADQDRHATRRLPSASLSDATNQCARAAPPSTQSFPSGSENQPPGTIRPATVSLRFLKWSAFSMI